jgi:hypothetical protein
MLKSYSLDPSNEEYRGSKKEHSFFLLIFIFNFICFHFFSLLSFHFLIFVLLFLFLFPRFLPCFSLFCFSPIFFLQRTSFFLVIFSRLLHFRLHSFLPSSLPFLSLFLLIMIHILTFPSPPSCSPYNLFLVSFITSTSVFKFPFSLTTYWTASLV